MSADWWQNFANNFAADLAPLISLFGESPTKQYLSETLTFLDIFIFSMAPMGVITALISAIRVAGGPSLRAFIGRAQEGAGIAEAELCSSTSRNVCELYNNGGIARVNGRPKILEFVHDWKLDTLQEEEFRDNAGIYSFKDYLTYGHWQEQGMQESLKNSTDEEKHVQRTQAHKDFAPHPNLSLNVGIRHLHRTWFYLAAILGFVLQAGVLAFAALVAYKYPREFQRDDSQIAVPGFPFVCAGTILLCIGVGICASIIERTTHERTFERNGCPPSRLYWVQPGDQVVGDQVFDCFAYSDANHPIIRYITSKREIERDNDTKRFVCSQSFFVWVAIGMTTVGFVLQFLGLRAVHSTVSVAQLGAMLIMSMVRAFLRMRHLKEEHNLLRDSTTLYLHHELDWLAIEMALENHDDSARGLLGNNRIRKPFWCITGPDETSRLEAPSQTMMYERLKDKAVKAYLKRVKLARMTGAQTLASTLIIDDPWEDVMVSSRIWASKLACAIEGVLGVINRRCLVKGALREAKISWSLRCLMGSASNAWEGNSSRNIIQLTISREDDGTGLRGPWKADRAQLESILGLWLWSIISVQRIQRIHENDPSGSDNSVHRASRLIHVLGDSDSSDSEATLRLWLGNHSATLQKSELNLVDATFYPSSLWVEESRELVYKQVREDHFRARQPPTARRIFGSNVISAGNLDDNEDKLLRVLHLPSASSLEMMCAQELFAIFFNAIVPGIDELRGNTEIVKGPHRFYVANSTLSEMVENFTSSGIGNHDDAIACMVPVLHSARVLNYSSAFLAARVAGEEFHQRNDRKRAENVLLSALKLALQDFDGQIVHLPGDTERTAEIYICLLSLCELYRWALLGDKRDRLLGLRGFVSLFKLFRRRQPTGADGSTDDQGEIPQDLLLYWTVALNMSKSEQDIRDIVYAIKELREQVVGPCNEIVEDFHGAVNQGNLEGALYALKPKIISSCTGRPVFAVAAQHGWYAVMKGLQSIGIDTRDVGHNGLSYLPYSMQCHALMIEDLIGDDEDFLRHGDDHGRTPLHFAAARGMTDVVMLITKRFSVEANARDQLLRTPIDVAVLSDHADSFAFLFDIEQADRHGSPPGDSWDLEFNRLFQAACCGSTEVALRLLAIMTDSSTKKLCTVKDNLLEYKKILETNESGSSQGFKTLLDLLEQSAYRADSWHVQGRTALSFAAEADKADLITYFLRKCAESTIVRTDNSGKTCLHHAVISRSESVVEALIESRYASSLLSKDKDGLDPLEYAVKEKSFVIASIILRRDPRRNNRILPGTSVATSGHDIYFQRIDSEIVCRSRDFVKEPVLRTVLPISARLYTPLAIIEMGSLV